MARRRSGSKKKSARTNRGLRVFGIIVLLLGIAGCILAFAPNTGFREKEKFAFIPTGASYETARQILADSGIVSSGATFNLMAKIAGYPAKVKSGRYRIASGMSNYSIIRLLGSGRQTPVKLVITKLRTRQDFLRLLSRNLEPGADSFERLLGSKEYLQQFDLDTATLLAGVVPATYELYWNTGADKAFRRIQKGYPPFWTEARKKAAAALNLTPVQATILASIVEEEYGQKEERGTIASVYLNRLRSGMKLQADPTAKFASGNFALRRITSAQTGIASPWNTYYVSGLPAGPICTPSASTIDAVLDAPRTDYLYFAAKPDGSGFHNFSATYAEHLNKAREYHASLDERNIH